MTSPSTPHAQLSVAVLQPRYPTPRLYSRMAGSTLVVTSCSANTLFITLLTPSTPCTRVRSAFQSARIKALNTVRRAQTGAVSGWPYLLPTPSLPRSFHVYISPPPRGISPPPPSFLPSPIQIRNYPVESRPNALLEVLGAKSHPTSLFSARVSRITSRSYLRCFLTESSESARYSFSRETFIRQSYLSLWWRWFENKINFLQLFLSDGDFFFSFSRIGERMMIVVIIVNASLLLIE